MKLYRDGKPCACPLFNGGKVCDTSCAWCYKVFEQEYDEWGELKSEKPIGYCCAVAGTPTVNDNVMKGKK